MDNTAVYHAFQDIVSPRKNRDLIKKAMLGNAPIQDVIDFGYGGGNFSLLFHNDNYLGIELLKVWVDSANKKYVKTNIQFLCGDEDEFLNLLNDSVD